MKKVDLLIFLCCIRHKVAFILPIEKIENAKPVHRKYKFFAKPNLKHVLFRKFKEEQNYENQAIFMSKSCDTKKL